MIYFQVKNKTGKILAGNMQEFIRRKDFEDKKNFSEKKGQFGIKGIYQCTGDVSVWVVAENEKDLLKSSALFKKTFEIYKMISLAVYSNYKKEITSYAHMLNTIQAQISQKIDDFADPKEFHGETYKDIFQKVFNIVINDQDAATDLICYIQKRIIDMRAQLLGSEIIHLGEQYEIKPVEVSLRRAILSQCSPFLEDFNKRLIKIRFYFKEDRKVLVDKNMFSLIMYNFFSNALKYAKPNSDIRFHYSDEEKSLDISMTSLKMNKEELTDLHKDGIRGVHAKDIQGKGIGLFVICKALELMNKKPMYISPNYKESLIEGDSIYIENHFRFLL